MQALKRAREISNIACGSKAWCRARSSFSASVPCDAPQVKKTGKRLPIAERRAMLELFVNRYRGENSGKFPTVSHAVKEVGGSYYVVKKIMQELKYNSKLPSSNVGKEVSFQTEVRTSYLSSGSKSNGDEYKPSPEIYMPMKPGDVKKEEPCQIVSDIDTSKTNGEVPQPFAEVSSANKSEDVKEEICCKLVLDVDCLESKNEEHRSSPSSPLYSIPMETDVTKEACHTLSDIDTSMTKREVPQPLPDVSCANKYEDDKEDILCKSVLGFSSLECKSEEHQSSHEYSIPTKPEVTKEEEPCQTVCYIDTSKTNGEDPQFLPEVSSAKKSVDAKELTHCEFVLDVDSLESKNEEPRLSHEYSIPKILENTKEEKSYKAVVDMDGAESIAEEHQKSAGELSEKQTLENIEVKSSIWGAIKSVAQDFMNIWRKG